MAMLLSFHGDPAVKAKYLGRVQAHHDADEIIKGQYWKAVKDAPLVARFIRRSRRLRS